ncbi:MAG: SRPBCC family protein [Rhodoferax sp.]|nr:MAG: SRPBCC family protein [Rhodoferax sp.]
MTAPPLRFHEEATVQVAASPEAVFRLLDDHQRLAAHMEKPSLMMAGATMHIDTDARKGQALGSVITLTGRVLGLHLSVTEQVNEYAPPLRKAWETTGTPQLLVIGPYRMGFVLTPHETGSQLRVWIDYDAPAGGWSRWLSRLLGRSYARWCVQRMAADAAQAFCGDCTHGNA